ncbi:LysR family transcriptional regulator [Sedimentitalea sp. JM2-8]|uniref:LysR family transcriptional regulator n=1 Tax=Sedimentitalea xiamensis TaxID=3050037 RepID=A0ABT7FFA0_9RHOB|nr:LysR family transcriptional regulator [Sedimentitalea xiamensis]MDK3073816.1 LysR family transcriptional regulator [Sedimentitalea xiamensis]
MRKPLPALNIGDADLKLLRVFKSVAQCGGVSAAEPELNIGRSTISKHLSDLELRLGLRLCSRGPAGFHLTDEGVQVLRATESLLDSVRGFATDVSQVRNTLAGTLRIACFDQCITNNDARLSSSIRLFSDRAPDVDLQLSLLPPNIIEAQLIEGKLDVGIVAMHKPSPALDYIPVHNERMYLYCGPSHPFFDRDPSELTLEHVKDARYAGISFNSPNLNYGQQLGLRPKAVVQNEVMLAVLVISGRYIGFMPDHMAVLFERIGKMRRVMPEAIHYTTDYAAATRRAPEPNRVTRVYLDCMKTAYTQPSLIGTL